MKYLFIDSNIYRDIFSPSEDFSKEIKEIILNLINKQKIKLLLPTQVKEEVERNRFSDWYETSLAEFKQKIIKREEEAASLNKKFEKYKAHLTLVKEIQKDKKDLEAIVKQLKTRFKDKKSKANQTLKEIFDNSEILDESDSIIGLADLRTKKRNPPRDAEGYFGDAIIWESLLDYFKKREVKGREDELIFVSNDKTAWGEEGLNLWLENEWKKKTNSKIRFVYSISDVGELTQQTEKIKKEEEKAFKENIIADFINSRNFMEAGSNAEKLVSIKEKLTKEDFERIMKGSLKNHEIYQSFFTGDPLKRLVAESDYFVVNEIENVEDELWERFKKQFNIDLMKVKEIPF